MSDPPASPRASRLATPGWLDGRLVLGLLLVLVSVVVGARVLSSADRSTLVWAASKDLTAGTLLVDGDLEPVRVRLFESAGQYVGAGGRPPVGYVVRRGLGAGELLPAGRARRARAGGRAPAGDRAGRGRALPADAARRPARRPVGDAAARADEPAAAPADAAAADARRGGAAAGPAEPLVLRGAQQVLSQVVVAAGPVRDELAGAGGTVPIVLQVRPQDVDEVVSAMGLGRLDLVRVPRTAEADGDVAAPVEAG